MSQPNLAVIPGDKRDDIIQPQADRLRVTILGCGGAGGVPSISDGWGACNPGNPRNIRRRASILVQYGKTAVLVDASPDARVQLLDAGIKRLDAVLFTHAHADHIHGIDELREVNRVIRGPLPVFADPDTLKILETRFGYAFEGIAPGDPFFRPWLVPTAIEPGAAFKVGGLKIEAFLQDHGFSTTLGFAFNSEAVYSTDVLELAPAAKAIIKGAKAWIVDAFTDGPHATHSHLDKTLGWIADLKPRRAVITHMGPKLDFDAVNHKCPNGVTAAYDGMVIVV